jgi:glycosyltransferase involved in cell wall biosynthesis
MNKHILVVTQYYYPENFRINDITKEWIKRGYKVTVVTGIPNYPKGRFFKGYGYFKKRRENIDGIHVIRVPIIPRFSNPITLALNYLSFVFFGWFWSKFTRIKADLVFNFEVSPMTQALPAIWYARRRRIPSIIYVQDLWPENLQIVGGINNRFIIRRVDKMVDKIYKNATKILVTSESFRDSIINRGVDEKKCAVWYQYAEDFYKPLKHTYRNTNEPLKIVFTGNIGEAQGLDILPKVATKLKENGYGNRVIFTIVGDGRNKQNLINEINQSSVTDMFVFVNAQPAIEIPKILAESDVAFLSFANNELFKKTIPAKLQSYMACGMPILAVADGESKRIINDSRCGYVSRPDDLEELYSNIISFFDLAKDDILLMSKNSIKYYHENFNKDKLLNFFDEIVKEHINV